MSIPTRGRSEGTCRNPLEACSFQCWECAAIDDADEEAERKKAQESTPAPEARP